MWLYIALGVFAFVYYVVKSLNYDHWEKRGIPTASGNEWFFGHFKPIIMVKKHLNDLYEATYKEYPDAPLVGYYIMNVPALLVKDLDIIKTILISEFSSFNFNGFVINKNADPLGAAHPFILKGEEWKYSRTQLTPSLSLAKLKGYWHNMLKVGDEMVKHVKKNVGTELDTREFAMMYSTDVIGNAIYGVENNTFENKESLISMLTREIDFETSVSENIKLFFQRLPIINMFFPARFTSVKLQKVMVEITRKIIKERKASDEKRSDLIQLLLTQKENDKRGVFTDEYMSGQVFVVILDLYETGSNAIAMLLYLLSKHPEVQERLRSEIMELKSKNDGELTIEDIENAKYLDMVYSETCRLFGIFISRECTSDCSVPMPGSEPFKITKGTPVIIPAGCIHKDPKYYPDPEKFDPERFTEEAVAKRPRFTYMPFGDGPKKCIGTRLVTLHIKAAIIKMVENFKLMPSPKTKFPFKNDPHYAFAIRPKGGVWVIYEPINK